MARCAAAIIQALPISWIMSASSQRAEVPRCSHRRTILSAIELALTLRQTCLTVCNQRRAENDLLQLASVHFKREDK